MNSFLVAAALFILVMVALSLARVLYGPGNVERMMAAQLLGSGGVAVLLLLSVATDDPAVLDVAVMLALLSAFASVAFVRRTEHPNPPPESGDRP